MTLITTSVLQAIAVGHRHGFEIADVVASATGTVYPALRRLESAGYVRSAWEAEAIAIKNARPQRRYYEITPAGERALSSAVSTLRTLGALHPKVVR